MKPKALFILLFVLAISWAALAEAQPVSVAVFDFYSPYHVRLRNDIGMVSSLLTANLSANPGFTVVDRVELNKILKEQALGMSGEISKESAARVGRLVGARVLVTGQIFSVGDATGTDRAEDSAQTSAQSQILIIANVIGTETGRVYSRRVQGMRQDLVKMADDLSGQISQTITNQYTNFIAPAAVPFNQRLTDIINGLPNKTRPAVSVQINEQLLTNKKPGQTSQSELSMTLKEAGFEIVDANSDKPADVVITGEASSDVDMKDKNGFTSVSASLNIKAQDRLTGKILLLDRQDATAVDLNRTMAAKKALQDAADDLSERLIPALAK